MHNENVFFHDTFRLKPHPTSIHVTLKKLLRFFIRMHLHVHIQATSREKLLRANLTNKVPLIILLQHVHIVGTFVAKPLTTKWTLKAFFRMSRGDVRTEGAHFMKIYIAMRTGLS